MMCLIRLNYIGGSAADESPSLNPSVSSIGKYSLVLPNNSFDNYSIPNLKRLIFSLLVEIYSSVANTKFLKSSNSSLKSVLSLDIVIFSQSTNAVPLSVYISNLSPFTNFKFSGKSSIDAYTLFLPIFV